MAYHSSPMLPTPGLLNELQRQQGRLPHGATESVREVERFKGYADAAVQVKLAFTENESQLSTTLTAKVFGFFWYSHSGLPRVAFYRDHALYMPELLVPISLDAHDDAYGSRPSSSRTSLNSICPLSYPSRRISSSISSKC